MLVEQILNQIELGNYALPEFQRGYVWNRDQVRKLMNSLYRGYPIGGLLTWVTPVDKDIIRNGAKDIQVYGNVDLILDGQQRITTLYGIIKGKAPDFFEGNANTFTGLYFNLDSEAFEFYLPLKMKDDRSWISVTDLMKKGAGKFIEEANADDQTYYIKNLEKLNKICKIKETDLHIQRVVGEDKTIDVVVEIFNNVNSGGTKLSKGDLALAKICAQWPEARNEMRKILAKYEKAGYFFKLDLLLRCVTVYATNKAYFSELSNISTADFQATLKETDRLISKILNQIASRLGLDHDRVLGSRYSIPVMIGYIHNRGEKNIDSNEWDKLLYWYIHTFLWGRYSGSTESSIAQDLNTVTSGGGIDGLINQLKQSRGTLVLTAQDFWGWSSGARFYPLLYMLTRVNHSKDWGTGLELRNSLLGNMSSLDVHHIFPKALLYDAGYDKTQVNALGNYTFLTKETNIAISDQAPKDYFPVYMAKTPGAMESHWIPMDPNLRDIDKYPEFLSARRELLANAANSFLNGLLHGSIQRTEVQDYISKEVDATPIEKPNSNEEDTILEVSLWMESNGLNPGEINYDLSSDEGDHLATIDLAWPDGIQVGLSEPVALLLNEPSEVCETVNNAGYRYFTDADTFFKYAKSYIE